MHVKLTGGALAGKDGAVTIRHWPVVILLGQLCAASPKAVPLSISLTWLSEFLVHPR